VCIGIIVKAIYIWDSNQSHVTCVNSSRLIKVIVSYGNIKSFKQENQISS
jgi:hypothetical protein